MHVSQVSVLGEDFVGLLGFASDAYTILSPAFKGGDVLGAPTLKTKVYGTNLVGLFCAGNSNGMLVPYFTSDSELRELREFAGELGVEVARVAGRYTALGNLVAANDTATYVSDTLRDVETIRDVLDVEVVSGDIAGRSEVGAYLSVTNGGFLAHPDAEDKLGELAELFKVQGLTGTVNRGIPYVKSGLIANSNGYITGEQTTGIELQRIDDALGFI
jgi:translation initiation factor 6